MCCPRLPGRFLAMLTLTEREKEREKEKEKKGLKAFNLDQVSFQKTQGSKDFEGSNVCRGRPT